MENNELDNIIKENTLWLRAFVRRRVNNKEDADDIVQDILYQFLRSFNVLGNPIAHVSAWLYTVAHNLIINHGKKHRESSLQTGSDSTMSDLSEILLWSDDENPDMQMLRKMVWAELDKALAELPQEQRDAIILTEIEGLTVKQAAERTGVPQNTFLSRKHYAVVHIRKRLQKLYDELTK